MRKFLQILLKKPILWILDYLSKAPKQQSVFKALSNLYNSKGNRLKKRLAILNIDSHSEKFIVFSDQHKGNRSWADDFSACEKNYISALNFYNRQQYTFINLGDSEELWKFNIADVLKHNENSFAAEAQFHPGRYYKTFGNHDVLWRNPLDVNLFLSKKFARPFFVYEGILLNVVNTPKTISILLTHGHQGDKMSSGNAFSAWVVAHIWMPLQRYLRININAPSTDFTLRDKHNHLMYDWSSTKRNLILITGHTHKPVFASGKYYSHPGNTLHLKDKGQHLKASYFNTGCCCYNDGDITGIEIAEGSIRLIKWTNEEAIPTRMVLEEKKLDELINDLYT